MPGTSHLPLNDHPIPVESPDEMLGQLARIREQIEEERSRQERGPLERQTRIDVAAMGVLSGGARATLAEMSFLLAATLDRAYADQTPHRR